MPRLDHDTVVRYALRTYQNRPGVPVKEFNTKMRAAFPTINPRMLRRAYQDTKMLFAIAHVMRHDKDD
jgi:hypothetical protein